MFLYDTFMNGINYPCLKLENKKKIRHNVMYSFKNVLLKKEMD